MVRVIGVASAKGGVGKTFVTVNLATVLAKMRYKVAVIDCNFTTSHIAIQFGMSNMKYTINDVLRGDITIDKAAYVMPSGLVVLPAAMGIDSIININIENIRDQIIQGLSNFDFVFLDGAPGLGKEALISMQAADELVFVANPNLASILDVVKVNRLANLLGKKVVGIVMNRVKDKNYEIKEAELEYITGLRVMGKIYDDENADRSLQSRDALVSLYPNSNTSMHFHRLASIISGAPLPPPQSRLNRFFSKFKRRGGSYASTQMPQRPAYQNYSRASVPQQYQPQYNNYQSNSQNWANQPQPYKGNANFQQPMQNWESRQNQINDESFVDFDQMKKNEKNR